MCDCYLHTNIRLFLHFHVLHFYVLRFSAWQIGLSFYVLLFHLFIIFDPLFFMFFIPATPFLLLFCSRSLFCFLNFHFRFYFRSGLLKYHWCLIDA